MTPQRQFVVLIISGLEEATQGGLEREVRECAIHGRLINIAQDPLQNAAQNKARPLDKKLETKTTYQYYVV